MPLQDFELNFSHLFPGGLAHGGPKFAYESSSPVYYTSKGVPAYFSASAKLYDALMPVRIFNRAMGKYDEHMRKTVADAIVSAKEEIKAEMAEVAEQVRKAVEAEIASAKAELQAEMKEKVGKLADEQMTAAAVARSLEEKTVVMERSLSESKEMLDKISDDQESTAAAVRSLEDLIRLTAMESRVEALEKRVGSGLGDLQEDLDRLDQKAQYFMLHAATECPTSLEEFEKDLEKFVRAAAVPPDVPELVLSEFLRKLRSEINHQVPGGCGLTQLEHGSCRLWTCDHRLCGEGTMSFYGALTKASREDNASLLRRGGMRCLKAIHSGLVSRMNPTMLLPPPSKGWDFRSYRGSGILPEKVDFWRKLFGQAPNRRKYRVPMPLASSLSAGIAGDFLDRAAPGLTKVLFIFTWPKTERCLHGVYIDGISACKGEDEMLLAAYSVVEADKMEESGGMPIKVFLNIMPDNRLEPEYLPVTDWH